MWLYSNAIIHHQGNTENNNPKTRTPKKKAAQFCLNRYLKKRRTMKEVFGENLCTYQLQAPGYPPPPPPPGETMGDLTASLCPGVWNLTTRLVTGVGHIDRRQSALWSPQTCESPPSNHTAPSCLVDQNNCALSTLPNHVQGKTACLQLKMSVYKKIWWYGWKESLRFRNLILSAIILCVQTSSPWWCEHSSTWWHGAFTVVLQVWSIQTWRDFLCTACHR